MVIFTETPTFSNQFLQAYYCRLVLGKSVLAQSSSKAAVSDRTAPSDSMYNVAVQAVSLAPGRCQVSIWEVQLQVWWPHTVSTSLHSMINVHEHEVL